MPNLENSRVFKTNYAGPAVNLLGGGQAIVNQCDKIEISQNQVNELLKMRNQSLEQQQFENFDIRDSEFDNLEPEFNF